MPIRPNFSMGQVVDPTRGAQTALSNVGTIMQQRQDAENMRIKQEQDAARLAMERQNAVNTSEFRAKQLENDLLKSQALKKYQNRVQGGIEDERRRKNQMEEGTVIADNFDIATTKDGKEITTTSLDKNALDALTNEIVNRPSDVPQTKDAIAAAYDEYLWENSPEQPEKSQFAQNNMFNELMYKGPDKGISTLTGKPIMNRMQFQEGLKADQSRVNTYLNTQAVNAASNPDLLREKGILTSSTSTPQVAMSGKEYIAAGNIQLKEYAKKYKSTHEGESMPKYLKLGVQKQLAAEAKAIDAASLLANTKETTRQQGLIDYDTKQNIKAGYTTKSAKGKATDMSVAKANYDRGVKELKRQWGEETNFLGISGTGDSAKTKAIEKLKKVLLEDQARIQKKYDGAL